MRLAIVWLKSASGALPLVEIERFPVREREEDDEPRETPPWIRLFDRDPTETSGTPKRVSKSHRGKKKRILKLGTEWIKSVNEIGNVAENWMVYLESVSVPIIWFSFSIFLFFWKHIFEKYSRNNGTARNNETDLRYYGKKKMDWTID